MSQVHRRLLRRGVAALLAAGCTGVLGVGPALAADVYADIDMVDTTGGSVEVLLSLHDLPADATPDASAVQVTLAVAVPAQAQLAAEAVGDDGVGLTRTAALVIDTSLSMRGERFAAAKQAATAFLDQAHRSCSSRSWVPG
ncbi:MAG: hypothetical protein M3419_03615 [Actinomycetota bacterium]|nr:hypothetical protein [Actinomycetota bacterium]